MGQNLTINVDFDRKCVECRKGGATDNGLCLECIRKALLGRPMRSAEGQAAQRRIKGVIATNKGRAAQ